MESTVKDQYFFGQVPAREFDFFAFPRSGSHFLRYCTQGLFDLVALRTPGAQNEEAISRQSEVNPLALYALDLREDGIPYAPVVFHTRATGQHGVPVKGEHPALILMRDPVATVYSYYRAARDRWNMLGEVASHQAWIRNKLRAWHTFYTEALALQKSHSGEVLLVRFEALRDDQSVLEKIVAFVGTRPKLSPAFVHDIMRFERFVRPGQRTFYVAGDDDAWQHDPDFCRFLTRAEMPDPAPMGYQFPQVANSTERSAP